MNPTPRSNAAAMTTNQWTPGPWMASHRSTQDGNGGTKRFHILAAPDQSIEVCRLKGWDDEDEANARLIALAPEMAQTIQDVLDWTEGDIEAHLELDADADLGHLHHRATHLRAILARINGEGGGV